MHVPASPLKVAGIPRKMEALVLREGLFHLRQVMWRRNSFPSLRKKVTRRSKDPHADQDEWEVQYSLSIRAEGVNDPLGMLPRLRVT